MILTSMLVIVAIFLISAIPLHIAVKVLGGKTSILKTAFTMLIAGIIVAAIKQTFTVWGGLISFFILIWIYHEVFKLKWLKALLAWVLHLVIILILYVILFLLFSGLIVFL